MTLYMCLDWAEHFFTQKPTTYTTVWPENKHHEVSPFASSAAESGEELRELHITSIKLTPAVNLQVGINSETVVATLENFFTDLCLSRNAVR